MRLNQFIARSSSMSRRAADQAIADGRVTVNGQSPSMGTPLGGQDEVFLDGRLLTLPADTTTILLNKPAGYICSRDGQGAKTIYELLPPELHELKPVGRLDKDSSGLLLLTNDGQLAYELTHPKFQKTKVYKIALDKPLGPADERSIKQGVGLDDGLSRLELERINPGDNNNWKVTMTEGRNRQIRRTFEALGYNVVKLHRTHFGPHTLDGLAIAKYKAID